MERAAKALEPSYVLGMGPGVAMLVGAGFTVPAAAYRTAMIAVGREGPLRVRCHAHHGEELTRLAFLRSDARREIDPLDTTVALLFVDWRTRAGRTLHAFDPRRVARATERFRDLPFPLPTAANMATTIARWFEAIGACDNEGPSHGRLGDFVGDMSRSLADRVSSSHFTRRRRHAFGDRTVSAELDSVGLGLAPIAAWMKSFRLLRQERANARPKGSPSPVSPDRGSFPRWLGIPRGVATGEGELVGLFGME